MTRIALTENTTVPLFTVIAASFAGIISFGGGLMWVAAISTRAETAHARLEQLEHKATESQANLDQLQALLSELKASNARIEGKIEILVQKDSLKR